MIPRDSNNPAYVFIPKDMAGKIPKLYATEQEADPLAVLKYFTPDGSWTWFLTEYDPEQRLAFGFVISHERELGYFSLNEMEELRGPMGLPVERDVHFQPKRLSLCR